MPQLREDRPASATFSLLAHELSAAGICFRFQAIGQSMYPTVRNGEMLHIEPLGNCKLKLGDIVLFRNSGEFKAHRIVKINGEVLTTRGDSSLQADGEVNLCQIIGRVVAKECGTKGRLVPLAGMVAHTKFRFRKLRAVLGRLGSEIEIWPFSSHG